MIDSELELAKLPSSLFKTILDGAEEGVYILDPQRRIVFWNKGAEKITGYKREEVVGSSCGDGILNHVDERGRSLCSNGCPAAECLRTGRDQHGVLFLRHKDGHRVPVRVSLVAAKDGRGKVIGAAETFVDDTPASAWPRDLGTLQRQVFRDHLTGIGNRRFLETKLKTCLAEMKRHGWAYGLVFIDLDMFKKVNDTFGHDVGDRVLIMTAKTLTNSLRSYDIVCRYGGDEFVAILAGLKPKRLQFVADKTRKLIERSSFTIKGAPVQVTASIGATLFRDNDTVECLLRRADRLMYRSKAAGRNRVTVL